MKIFCILVRNITCHTGSHSVRRLLATGHR